MRILAQILCAALFGATLVYFLWGVYLIGLMP